MSRDQHSEDETPTVNTDALGAWVAETAAKKDVSERELLDEILSSYWVLEELSDVVLTSETDPDGGDRRGPRRDSYTEPPRGAATDRERYPPDTGKQPAADDASTTDDDPVTDDASTTEDESSREKEPATQSPSAAEPASTPAEGELSAIEQELEKLRTVIDGLADEGSLPTPDAATATGSDTPADTASTVDPDEAAAELVESLSSIPERGPNSPGAIAELDDELVEIRERLSELEADLTDRVAAEADARAELESWIETEFDNVEDVLQHLLSTTDNLEYRLGSAIDSQREQLEPLQAARADQKHLKELKNEAIEKGVNTADCDSCGETIDLRLLPAPHCPSCDQTFTGVTDSSWWPFDSATLRTTTARRPQADHAWGNTADQQTPPAPSGSNQNSQQSSDSHTGHPNPDTDAEPRPDENGFDQFDA